MYYDFNCPVSNPLPRDEHGRLTIELLPSPLHWSRQVEWPFVLRHGHFEKGHRVLDVGGGWSVLKFAVADRVNHVTSLEVDPEFIQKAQPSIDLLGKGKVSQVLGDARDIPFRDGYFDRVVCVSVVEHIESGREQAVREMVRVLKPGGLLLLTMDVGYEGVGKGNFHLGQREAAAILKEGLGLDPPQPRPGSEVSVSFMAPEDIHIFVVMTRYVKPLKGTK